MVHRGDGAVIFCDASGFTKLTEHLAQSPNGAELLSSVLNVFFTPLIELINAYRGDIIKFSGDALTILFLADEEDKVNEESDLPCGSGWARCGGHSALELAVLRASACCIEIHKKLDNFDTGIPDRTLSFHIGVGCGECVVLHLGGEASPDDPKTRRFEYVICGEPLEQIAHACHYAEIYETVLSPQAWKLVAETVIEGPVVVQDPGYKRLGGLVNSRHTYATIRFASQSRDERQSSYAMKLSEMGLAKRYIPSAVYKQMENGTLEYVNDIRTVTVFFICVAGVDVATPTGSLIAQDLMCSVQSACYEQEGQVNKFLVDDKGLLFLCVFGTPPMVHTDDPLRAIRACFAIIGGMKRLGLTGHFGVSTGRVFCGVVGSSARQEYTTLGDSVNLAARFMQLGKANTVLVDSATFEQTKSDLDYNVLEPVLLKGKANLIPVYEPKSKGVLCEILSAKFHPRGSIHQLLEENPKPGMLAYAYSVMDSFDNLLQEIEDEGQKFEIENSLLEKDPLVECTSWKELKFTRRILEESFGVGGTIVFGGQSGLGKDQLSHVVVDSVKAATKNRARLVQATDQGVPRDRARPIIEFFEACLLVSADLHKAASKIEGLSWLAGMDDLSPLVLLGIEENNGVLDIPNLNNWTALSLPTPKYRGVRRSFFDGSVASVPTSYSDETRAPMEAGLLDICEQIACKIIQYVPLVCILKISRGTSLFNIVKNPTFWRLVERMSRLSFMNGENSMTVVLLCRSTEEAFGYVHAEAKLVELQPLGRTTIEEYVGKILKLDVDGANNIPHDLIDFVEDLTRGNPLYIIETLEQLVVQQSIVRGKRGFVSVNCDLGKDVCVADWSHTSMVGRVICQLEALGPQEAAIVKMATVFEGPFSVLDIAASLKSPFTKACRFDNYRMYRTCARLVQIGILAEIPHLLGDPDAVPVNDMSRFSKDTDPSFIEGMSKIPMFILDNFLIRKVAGGVILKKQALKVKRQAMMHRVINKEVPLRLEAHRNRINSLHLPYYNLVKL